RKWVDDLLEAVGLSLRDRERYPHEFSGGQRQRIGIARALALGPELLIADEPVSALDVSVQAQILDLMREIQSRFKLSILFISHDLSVVRFVCDRVGVMYLGELVELAATDNLFSKPLHPYTQTLLSAIPEPTIKSRRRLMMIEGEIPSPIDPPPGCRFHPRCSRAEAICRGEEPAYREHMPGHWVACHFVSPSQPAADEG
ncbi:MAG: ABC transporter ATP-binding protein, partial [Rhodospirillales bacterium]|nr:ABC transporter ATP-binding protein [Rhodospirillales bacterium]